MTPYYDEDGITIYHGDCREVLPSVSGDLVFADPPYGVGFPYLSHNDTEIVPPLSWLDQCRAIAPTLVTPGYRNLYSYPIPDNVIIRYDSTAQSPASIAWLNRWEPVLVYGRPPGRLNEDVIRTYAHGIERREVPLGSIDHPAPKPLGLLRSLLAAFTTNGDTVIDPFVGSGTTLKAARELGRRAIGIEIEERYCEIAVQRLAQGVLNFG